MKKLRYHLLFTAALLFAGSSLWTGEAISGEAYEGKTPKYVFLFIGDGMSFPQATSLGIYRGTIDRGFVGTLKEPTIDNPPQAVDPSFTAFPVIGAARTYDASKFITDSASAATAIASGFKTLDGRIGVDVHEKSIPTIAELLKEKHKYKIGIVTSVSLDHATPAGFYAHQASRNNFYEIGLDLIKSDFDYFGGGGLKRPTGKDGNQKNILDLAKESGYTVSLTKADTLALKPGVGKAIAINPVFDNESDRALPFAIDGDPEGLSLAEYTKKGIELLENDTGFFMMVEGGKIDWAAHANDAMTLIKDVLALEEAVNVAVDFYKKHPDETLIIVTGDHETGGLTMGFGGTMYDTFFSLLTHQKLSYGEYAKRVAKYRADKTPFETVVADLADLYGLAMPGTPAATKEPRLVLDERDLAMLKTGYDESMIPFKDRKKDWTYRINYSMYDHEPLQIAVTHALNNKAGIGWTSSAHTGLPAAVYAIGAGQDVFNGFFENTDIFHKIKKVTKTP